MRQVLIELDPAVRQPAGVVRSAETERRFFGWDDLLSALRNALEELSLEVAPAPSALKRLSPQELQVARLVARGASNKQAAALLCVSPKTIEFHLSAIYRKLGVESRTQLTRLIADEETAG